MPSRPTCATIGRRKVHFDQNSNNNYRQPRADGNQVRFHTAGFSSGLLIVLF
jgi:hypothetical protein